MPGEIVPSREFYDYESKYEDDDSELLIPAPITSEQTKEVQRLAIAAFQAVECSGLARVDCFLEKGSGGILLNEVNTMPGFTSISMYPKLWEAQRRPLPRAGRPPHQASARAPQRPPSNQIYQERFAPHGAARVSERSVANRSRRT